MRFKIKECKTYGIKNPNLFFNGWIENDAVELHIKLNGETSYRKQFPSTKSKIHTFDIRAALNSGGWVSSYSIEAIKKDGSKQVIFTFQSTPLSRYVQKIKELRFKGHTKKDTFKEYRPLIKSTYNLKNEKEYNEWIKKYESFNPVEEYQYNPLISIIIPVYNVERKYLTLCLDSILSQTYQNFEICLADDCSTNRETIATLKEYETKDKRIKVFFRKENGHISEASNSALSLASGEFVAMMDNDDELMPQALNEVVSALNDNEDLDFIYTDEDKIDLKGHRSDPQFKPDLSIDKLYGGNYICHFNVIRKSILDQVGGFRKGYEGAQDFDLFIRIVELTKKFYHIPKVLYHWRMIPGSTALDSGSKNYAGEAGKRSLEDLLEKKGKNAQVDIVVNTHYSIEYILDEYPLVEAIMLVDQFDESLKKRLTTMYSDSAYENLVFTFICKDVEVANSFFKELAIPYSCIVLNVDFATTVNKHISNSKNEYFLFIDQLATIDTFDGINVMVGHCSQGEIGVVGSKVLNIHKTVIASGYFLLNRKMLPVHYATYQNDYGHYGSLLVPNNYRIIENVCFMVSKCKYINAGGLESDLDMGIAYYSLFLNISAKGYRNVILPRIEVLYAKPRLANYENKLPIEKWDGQGFNVDYDEFYNVNLSDKIGFRLDK